jgi:hypothetical protein
LFKSLAVKNETSFGTFNYDCLNLGEKYSDLLLGVRADGRCFSLVRGNLRKSKSVTTLVKNELLFK